MQEKRPVPYLDLCEAAEKIRRRDLTSVALTELLLERIDTLDPRLGAYVCVMADSALAQAHAADAEIDRGHVRGPLHGVPIALKDIFWTAGAPTAAGMPMHSGRTSPEDATVVRRLRDAGAVILGKLTLTEGVYAEHRAPFHAPKNPWSAKHWSGASSSGSAVAVAAGLACAALASETGGSIKLPAAATGVTGLKPTWGRVSRHGVVELAASLDHVGAMARSAADLAAVLGCIAGADARDPTASQKPVADYLAAVRRPVSRLRVGLDARWTKDVDPAVGAAFEGAVAQLSALGFATQPVQLPEPDAMVADWFGLCAVQAAVAHEQTFPAREKEYGPALADLLRLGHAVSGMDYQRLLLRQRAFRGEVDAVFQHVDLIALPVLSFPTPTLQRMSRVDEKLIAGLHRFTCPFAMSGHPGLVMPCGFTADQMPLAFQLIGPHFGEANLLAAGHAFQQASHWHRMHPQH
jgi:amidase